MRYCLNSVPVSLQAAGLVPVVEPEILIDGAHDSARFGEVTQRVVSETVKHMWQQVGPCCCPGGHVVIQLGHR